MTKEELWRSIERVSKLTGKFALRSGSVSNSYFDKYRFESDPKLLDSIAKFAIPLIPPGTEILAGLEMGGIPVATMLSHHTGIPAAFIRKEPKKYGTCKYAEGAELYAKKVTLIEDVVSSGGAIIDAATMLRSDGIAVSEVICVIDRDTGGREKIAEQGLNLNALFKVATK